MNVQLLINKAVTAHNEKNTEATETRVKYLVDSVIKNEAQIKLLQAANEGHKKELKELQMPEPISLEL